MTRLILPWFQNVFSDVDQERSVKCYLVYIFFYDDYSRLRPTYCEIYLRFQCIGFFDIIYNILLLINVTWTL